MGMFPTAGPLLMQALDLLSDYKAFQNYNRNGLVASLRFCTGADMSGDMLTWAYELCRGNMEEMYR